jgi:hypothetical protein
VRHLLIVDHLDAFQLAGSGPEVLEETGSCAQEDWHEVDPHLVEQPCLDVLLAMFAPPITMTSIVPAAARAFSRALSIPSGTKT